MRKYHKIHTIFKRQLEKPRRIIEGDFSLPEFEYLKNNRWDFTEKVDGTNIRIGWDGEKMQFGGRTDNAQVPMLLITRLYEIFNEEKLAHVFEVNATKITGEPVDVTLYGEGYGARIQKGGGNYIPDAVDFILFDVLIGDWWLQRGDVEDIAHEFGIKVVPYLKSGTLKDAVEMVRNGMKSTWGDFQLEGLVMRPHVELKTRAGHRVIGKIKVKDFKA